MNELERKLRKRIYYRLLHLANKLSPDLTKPDRPLTYWQHRERPKKPPK